MANVNAASGFTAVKHLTGAPYNGQAELMYIPSTDSSQYFIGDPVKLAGSADSVTGAPTIITPAAGDTCVGVIQGFDVSAGVIPNLNIAYRPASTAMYAFVSTATDIVYNVQVLGTTGVVAADIGMNINLKTGTGSTTTNLSGFGVDDTTIGTTNTKNFHLVRLTPNPANSFAVNDRVQVIFNTHAYAPNTAGQ